MLREAVELAPTPSPAAVRPTCRSTSVRTDHLLTLVDDVGIVQHANGVIPNREQRLLRRRCRPARGRRPGARSTRRRAAVDHRPSTGRSHSCRTPPTPRGACATSWATTAGGSTSRTSATTSAAPSGRWARSSRRPGCPPSSARTDRLLETLVARSRATSSLRTAAYAALGLARLDADRLEPGGAAAAGTARGTARRSAYAANASEDWHWFEDRSAYDNARLPQALDRRRQPCWDATS